MSTKLTVIPIELAYTASMVTVGDTSSFAPVSVDLEVVINNDNADFNSIRQTIGNWITYFLAGSFILSINDPVLPYMLSPKSGHSIQEWITLIKESEHFKCYGYAITGVEAPPATVGNKILIVTAVEPKLEAIADCLYAKLTQFNILKLQLTYKNSGYSVIKLAPTALQNELL